VCKLFHEPTQIECSLTHTTFPSIADLSSEIFLAFPILLYYIPMDGWLQEPRKRDGCQKTNTH
jgi:hypothetical protein